MRCIYKVLESKCSASASKTECFVKTFSPQFPNSFAKVRNASKEISGNYQIRYFYTIIKI